MVPSVQKIRDLIKVSFLHLILRFKKKPYSTLFLVIITFGNIIPISLFLFVMVSLSSLYFLAYLIVFLFVGVFASFFIVPLLGISFVFATCVVVFGFLSDMTFKFAQAIYIKTDHGLKSTLGKMGTHTKKKESEKPNVMKNFSSARFKSANRDLISSNNGIDIPSGTTSAASAIARSLETRADMRVTS